MLATKRAQSVKRKPNNKKQQKKMKPQQKQKTMTRKNPNRNRVAFNLSPCADLYLKALVNPFAIKINGELPCVPDMYDIPSKKFGFTKRGLISIGANGMGYVSASPFSISPGTSQPFLKATSKTTATYDVINDGTGIDFALGYIENSPQLNSYDFRPVCLGLRVRYIGTELNRSGRIVPFTANYSLIGSSLHAAATVGTVQTQPVDRKWHGTYWRPSNSSDYDYKNVCVGISDPRVGIWVSGVPGTGDVFEYEATAYYECQGIVGVQQFTDTTRSHSDPVGLGMIRDFVGQAATSEIGQSVYSSALEYMRRTVINHATSYVASGPLLLTL